MSKQIDALKLALEAFRKARRKVLTTEECHAVIMSIKEALRERAMYEVQRLGQEIQPEQEPVAWPCVIAEADFSENTVTLAMQCTDYKVSAGKHWLSTNPPQRTWVGLTPQERDEINEQVYGAVPHHVAFHAAIEAKLKQKNGYDS